MPPAPPRLLQFRPQPRPIGVQFGVTVCHSPQFIEHAGDILRHADLIGLAPLQNALDVKGLRQNASSTFPSGRMMSSGRPCPHHLCHGSHPSRG